MLTALRRHRKTRNLRQSDLALLLRIDQTTVSLWENAKARPTRRHAADLERLLGVPAAELLKNDEDAREGASVTTAVSPAEDLRKVSDGG